MYNVKFVGASTDDATDIVPAGRVSYEIELVENFEEFIKLLDEWDSYWMPYEGPGKTFVFPEWGIKVAVVQLYAKPFEAGTGEQETVILVNGYAYVMNENGKTIDRIL